MAKYSRLYIGLDTHKDSIVAAAVGVERGSEVVDFGRIATTHHAIDKLIKKLQGSRVQCTLFTKRVPAVIGCNVT